jgi:transposase-like protein
MKVRCQRCGYTFTLSRESVAAALGQVEQTQAKHYNVDCPKCRRQIKVSVKELRRFKPDQM